MLSALQVAQGRDHVYWGMVGEPTYHAEKSLIGAVLNRALKDLGSYNWLEVKDALAWFKEDSDRPFSYRYCVQQLNLTESHLNKVAKAVAIVSEYRRDPRQRKVMIVKAGLAGVVYFESSAYRSVRAKKIKPSEI